MMFNTKIVFRKIKLIFVLKNLFWKLKMSNFWQVRLKLSYKISKNTLRWLIGMQKTIEIHLPHYEIPQPSPHKCTYSIAANVLVVILAITYS